MGDAGTYALSACDNLSQGSVIAIRADAAAMRDAADAARRSTPEPARARPLPPPLVGLENGSRGLKEWLDDDVAGAQAVSKEERWHVGWRILAFLDDVASRGRASYESFDASCLDISPQGAISFSARANVSSKTEDVENPFVELAQEPWEKAFHGRRRRRGDQREVQRLDVDPLALELVEQLPRARRRVEPRVDQGPPALP